MNTFSPTLLAIAFVVVIVLAVIALYYQYLLIKKQRKDRENEEELGRLTEERSKRNKNSIRILAQAVIDDQVTLTEASIRINTLAQALYVGASANETLLVFRQVSEATAHIPIWDKWKALSKLEKQKLEREREVIEDQYREFAVAAAKKITAEEI